MNFKLSRYILPAVISMVVVGTNANIDGFFIGRLLGDDGLAAINIVWPIVAFITSLGTGIGVGGSVILSRKRGEGDAAGAESVKNTTLLFLLLVGLATGALCLLLSTPLLRLMGAEGAVLTYAAAYARVISLGATLQILAAGLVVLLRNDEKTYQSMAYALLGLALHVGLNFLLASRWVMEGVAAATVLSQGVIMVLGLWSLRPDRRIRCDLRHIGAILRGSMAPFGINFVPSLVLLLTNALALRWGGVAAVSAYAAMSYAVYTFDYVFQGVCDGIQPVVSYCHGAGDRGQERRAMVVAAVILAVFSCLCIALTPALVRLLPPLLGVSGEAAAIVARAFWIYAASYPFKAAVKYICSYYYAVEQQALSSALVYLDPLLLTPAFLLGLGQVFQLDGVWLAMPAAQVELTCMGLAVVLWKRKK